MNIDYELLWEIGQEVEADNVRAHYSGRAMYGATCPVLDLDSETDLIELGAVIERLVEDNELKTHLLRGLRIDSMGRGIVAYWETMGVDNAPEEDED